MGLFDKFKSFAEEVDDILTVLDKHTPSGRWLWTVETPTGKCPKCGSVHIEIKYDKTKDKLNKKCLRCDYAWEDDPLDKKQ